jgi:hypothetical protein
MHKLSSMSEYWGQLEWYRSMQESMTVSGSGVVSKAASWQSSSRPSHDSLSKQRTAAARASAR